MNPKITRRAVLQSALGGALAVGLAACSKSSRARTSPRPDARARRLVVVVGGGLAGLTAALDLVEAGWDVVVLEARDRVGGRVHTLYTPFSTGLHAEAGGESIDDTHDAILALIKRFGLTTERRPADKIVDGVVFYEGQRYPTADFLQLQSGAVLADYARFFDAVSEASAEVDPEHPERADNAEKLDAMTAAEFVTAQHLLPEAELLVRTNYRGNYNSELEHVSMLFIAQQTVVTADVPESAVEAMRITGGNSLLPEAMADDLGERLVLGAPVDRVEHGPDGVRVRAGSKQFDAAWLVVACPMNPLRRVRFDPALPTSVRNMVEGLDLGQAAKVTVEYPQRFWENAGLSGFAVTDLDVQVVWSPTDSYASQQGLLTSFITGAGAQRVGKLDPAARVSSTVDGLTRIYPNAPLPVADHAARTVWAQEQYTGGGYAVYQPGQMIPFWPVVRSGTGRIRFAGEQTETLAGYMESAVRSGERIAAELGRPPNES